MKKILLLISLWFSYASAAATFPAFPAYDPFTNATASGGTSYAAGTALAGQTNAMGQNWFSIDSSGTVPNEINVTSTPLSYLGMPGFSGNAILLTNTSGPGARMFTATNSSGFFVTGPLSFFYSLVISVSNLTSLSTVGDYCIGISDQSVIANQGPQPGTVASRLYFKKVNGTNFQVGISKNGGVTTNYVSTLFTTNQVLFVVLDYEIITTIATAGTRDNVRLWVNPDPSTFGASSQPAESASVLALDADLTPFISAVQFHNRATDTPNNLFVTSFRMGTNWSWVTGGPAIGSQPIASTNVSSGGMTLNVTAMNNGTANGYQWQFNGVNLTDGPSVSGSGATVSGSLTSSLTITNMLTADAGSYTVIVTNTYGTVTSSVSAVTTFSKPTITSQPNPTNLMLFSGATNTISVAAAGFAPLTFNWFSNSTLVQSATTTNFTINNAQASANFFCVVTNSFGSATSSVVSLTVAADPTSPYPLAVFNDHPLSFFPLNEVPDDSAGDNGRVAFDYSGGNNGFYTNVVLNQQGYGQGLASEFGYSPATDTGPSVNFGQFASQNSYVAQIPNINFGGAVAPSFSVEAWVNTLGSTEAGSAGIINKGFGGGGEQFTLDNNSGWRFFIRNAVGTTTIAQTTNTTDANWHHLVGVVDAGHSNITLYLDGFARTNVAFTPSAGILASTNAVAIGSRMSSATSAFNDNFTGDIQDVAIYNYALTSNQVANHFFAAGIAPTVAALPSSTTVNEGTTLTVPSTAAGSPALAYQWFDVTSGSPGTPLPGQTNAALVISNISSGAFNNHSLDVTVTNLYGQVTSSAIFVQVISGPASSVVITPAMTFAYTGAAVPFTATAQGSAPFAYQWSVNGTPVSGATNSAYINIPAVAGSYTIGCEVTNSLGAAPLATASLTVVTVPSDFYATTVLKDSPSAFWRLDEPSNAPTAFDYVGGHTASYVSALNGQPGFSPATIPSETSTIFGTNGITPSYAEEVNNTASGIPELDFSTQGANAEFSVETWVALPAGEVSGDFVCKGFPNNTQFALDSGGTGGAFRFVIHNTADTIFTANSGSLLPDGNCHHVVGVCDEAGGKILIYVDGTLRNTTVVAPGSGVLSLGTSGLFPIVLAAQESQTTFSFTTLTNTALSQVAIYSYPLTAAQISTHFFAATFVSPTISAAFSGTNLVLTYTGTLVSSTNVTGPITNVVAGATSPYTVPTTNLRTFFRARATQ